MSTWEALQEKVANLKLFIEDWRDMEAQLEREPSWQMRHTLNEPRKTIVLNFAAQFITANGIVAELMRTIRIISHQIDVTRQELSQNSGLSAATQSLINRMDSLAEQTLHTAQGLRDNFIAILNILRALQCPPVDDNLNPFF